MVSMFHFTWPGHSNRFHHKNMMPSSISYLVHVLDFPLNVLLIVRSFRII